MRKATLQATAHYPICNWAREDRPREKFIDKGPHTLSTTELLGLIINTGSLKKSALELSREIMQTVGNDLGELAKMNVQQLLRIHGVGPTKAVQIAATMELARRKQAGYLEPGKTFIFTAEEAAMYMKPRIGHQKQEVFHVFHLANNNRLLHLQHLSSGGMSATIVDPKLIYNEAILRNTTRLIFCHNHPSGSLQASDADIRLTKSLCAAGKALHIEVIDHIIVSDAGYCSMFDQGLM